MINFDTKERGLPTSGFTMIELLTVIAIIALLASLLLSALSGAKTRGQQIFCLNNARQQIIGIILYSDDNGDFLPPVSSTDPSGEEIPWSSLLQAYFPSPPGFLCPGDKQSRKISYGLNEIAFVDEEDDPAVDHRKLGSFFYPTHTIAVGDLGTGDDYMKQIPDARKMVPPSGDLDDDEDGRPSARHNRRCNLSFMDGHSEALHLSRFYRYQLPPDRWFNGR